ncbi:MAG TPA: DUF3471 domain-containing protein [Pyrinomonadaceae bacterium]|jgi:hypothetical protein
MLKTLSRRALAFGLVLHLAAACAYGAGQAGAKADVKADVKAEAKPKAGAPALREYVGRYELEVGLIPVSTLDVTLEGGELWMKPSQAKKRRLSRARKAAFTDELEGKPVGFGRDDEGRVTTLTFFYEGEPYTARRVELPEPSLKGNTTFRLKGYPDASVVVLTGTFNNWHQSQLVFGREEGGWVCRVDLDPGVYRYKFVVDGDWLLDPSNPDTAEDEAGNVNNVLEVKPL